MVMCFVPDCKHYSERDFCKFFAFPRDALKWQEWVSAIRRADRGPSRHSVVCSCHFEFGLKQNGPTIFERNRTWTSRNSLPNSKRRWSQNPVKSDIVEESEVPEEDEIKPRTSKDEQYYISTRVETVMKSEDDFLRLQICEIKSEPLHYEFFDDCTRGDQ